MTKDQKESIRQEVQDNLGAIIYDFEQVIDNSMLTETQKKWALKNLDWKVVYL